MRSLVFFTLLILVALCAVVDASKHHRSSEGLASRFVELEELKGLHPKHRQLIERAVQEFERTIDKSGLDADRKDAAKQMALEHFMSRLAERKH